MRANEIEILLFRTQNDQFGQFCTGTMVIVRSRHHRLALMTMFAALRTRRR